MAIPDHLREFPPARAFREGDPTTLYWVRGKEILYRHYPLKGADIKSFSFYLGSFGKDCKHCYCTSTRLAGGNGATFRTLNFTYATDGLSIWTMGGRIKNADAESFMVCDDGVYYISNESPVPYGFGKDKNRVYYYDFDGKPNWVRKASPASFVSLNDGHYGKDDCFVFCGSVTLPKAKVEHWRKVGGYYSKDDARVFYFNRLIPGADYDTFEVANSEGGRQLAKDKNHFYDTDRVVDKARFLERLHKCGPMS